MCAKPPVFSPFLSILGGFEGLFGFCDHLHHHPWPGHSPRQQSAHQAVLEQPTRSLALSKCRSGASNYCQGMTQSLPLSYWSPEKSYMTSSRTARKIYIAARFRVNNGEIFRDFSIFGNQLSSYSHNVHNSATAFCLFSLLKHRFCEEISFHVHIHSPCIPHSWEKHPGSLLCIVTGNVTGHWFCLQDKRVLGLITLYNMIPFFTRKIIKVFNET